jgi:hypothetical protein
MSETKTEHGICVSRTEALALANVLQTRDEDAVVWVRRMGDVLQWRHAASHPWHKLETKPYRQAVADEMLRGNLPD